ncbi:MAG: histidinol-phosphate transaminase [Solobacterium sp.]|nr:histidinol-phosphate transaminase [Solobacterium sp.]
MSRYIRPRLAEVNAYIPGEQPQERKYIKLNTNESPYAPLSNAEEAVLAEVSKLRLYSDPSCTLLKKALAERYGVKPEQISVGNGSDEVLNFAFMAYTDKETPVVYPEISYGFYSVLADLYGVPRCEIPVRDDMTIDPEDYADKPGMIIIANPNAPTGLLLDTGAIRRILDLHREGIVLVDEAYIDFGGISVLPLLSEYDNLLIVRTFSKSRSLAGARLGFAIGSPEVIADLEKIRCSTNPYNINRMTVAAALAVLAKDDVYMENCRKIMNTRERVAESLQQIGCTVIPSMTNFLFVKAPGRDGKAWYEAMREQGILVRYFGAGKTSDYIRVSIGSDEEMDCFLKATEEWIGG